MRDRGNVQVGTRKALYFSLKSMHGYSEVEKVAESPLGFSSHLPNLSRAQDNNKISHCSHYHYYFGYSIVRSDPCNDDSPFAQSLMRYFPSNRHIVVVRGLGKRSFNLPRR